MTTRSRIKLRVAKDKDELRRLAAELIAKKIHSAVEARGRCSIALSGGPSTKSSATPTSPNSSPGRSSRSFSPTSARCPSTTPKAITGS
jgi:hypothetical protein